jgi:hypothetical protein
MEESSLWALVIQLIYNTICTLPVPPIIELCWPQMLSSKVFRNKKAKRIRKPAPFSKLLITNNFLPFPAVQY